jgi:trans-aconitate methyltransferase
MTVAQFGRRLWARLWLRRSQFTGAYGKLKALYAVEDPWELSSEREQERFEKTNALIRTLAPDCKSLLELGCGEGFQTSYLLKSSASVTGVEVSSQAVARARVRCPKATFKIGRAEDVATLVAGERFDIATAFEVLYYSKNVDAILSALQAIAPIVLVTNFADRARQMTGCFDGPGWRRLDDLTVAETVWQVNEWSRART